MMYVFSFCSALVFVFAVKPSIGAIFFSRLHRRKDRRLSHSISSYKNQYFSERNECKNSGERPKKKSCNSLSYKRFVLSECNRSLDSSLVLLQNYEKKNLEDINCRGQWTTLSSWLLTSLNHDTFMEPRKEYFLLYHECLEAFLTIEFIWTGSKNVTTKHQ